MKKNLVNRRKKYIKYKKLYTAIKRGCYELIMKPSKMFK